jgi:hypothetical protein
MFSIILHLSLCGTHTATHPSSIISLGDLSLVQDPESWNKPPVQGKGGKGVITSISNTPLGGKGKGAPPTPPGRLPPAMPTSMSIPRATNPSNNQGSTPQQQSPHDYSRYPVAQATPASHPTPSPSDRTFTRNTPTQSNIYATPSNDYYSPNARDEASYSASQQQEYHTHQHQVDRSRVSQSVSVNDGFSNPFVDYGDYGDVRDDDDIVFITDSPERRAHRQQESNSSHHSGYETNQNLRSGGNSGSNTNSGGNGGTGPGGWWRNMRNRNNERNDGQSQSGGGGGRGNGQGSVNYEVHRVSLRNSISTVAFDNSGEMLLATGDGGDGSELGMVREDQPHLIVSLLQARNMIPPASNGRMVQKFTSYFVVNYGGFERKTTVYAYNKQVCINEHTH